MEAARGILKPILVAAKARIAEVAAQHGLNISAREVVDAAHSTFCNAAPTSSATEECVKVPRRSACPNSVEAEGFTCVTCARLVDQPLLSCK